VSVDRFLCKGIGRSSLTRVGCDRQQFTEKEKIMTQINRHQIGGLFLVFLYAACQPLSASTTGTFDFQQVADNHASRWEAMARFYEEMGLLNR
jgi:hypothetical protein